MSHAAKKGIIRAYQGRWGDKDGPYYFENEKCPEWIGSLEKTWERYAGRCGGKSGDLSCLSKEYTGCVYLISYELGGPLYYKAGMSKNMEKRLKSFKDSMPDGHRKIKLLKYVMTDNASLVETRFLVAVRDYLVTSEWFRLDIGKHRTYLNNILEETFGKVTV